MTDLDAIKLPSKSRLSVQAPVALGYTLAAIILMTDLLTKYWVHAFTPYGWSQPVTGFFNLVHHWNRGAAFSFLADAGGWQRLFFIAIAAGVSIWLIAMLRKPRRWIEQLAFSLILGGALGNGFDRAARGYVVDFLDFHWAGWHWPAFNVADIGIVCGAVLMVLAAVSDMAAARGTRLSPQPPH